MSVWKRLQRVGKTACKFQFTVSYQEVEVECTKKWQPDKICVVGTRRNRRRSTQLHSWQPMIQNPYRGMITWSVPENVDIMVTLFKDPRHNEFEDKDWTFVIEEHAKNGRRKVLASQAINMKDYATLSPSQNTLKVKLIPVTRKVVAASVTFTLSCMFLRQGKATDEDMQSIASLMSINNTDIGNLDDLDEDDEGKSLHTDLSSQINEMAARYDFDSSSVNGNLDDPDWHLHFDVPEDLFLKCKPRSKQAQETSVHRTTDENVDAEIESFDVTNPFCERENAVFSYTSSNPFCTEDDDVTSFNESAHSNERSPKKKMAPAAPARQVDPPLTSTPKDATQRTDTSRLTGIKDVAELKTDTTPQTVDTSAVMFRRKSTDKVDENCRDKTVHSRFYAVHNRAVHVQRRFRVWTRNPSCSESVL